MKPGSRSKGPSYSELYALCCCAGVEGGKYGVDVILYVDPGVDLILSVT